MTKTTASTEYGDFQTPTVLAEAICTLLSRQGLCPKSLLEPTCGCGNLLFAGLDRFTSIEQAFGAEINSKHVEAARVRLQCRSSGHCANIEQRDFFQTNWREVIAKMPEPILVLGNPPWVTNATLGAIGSENLPVKSNFQNHNGLDAITGKANFDISEWMLLRLTDSLNGRTGTLAMLCKSSVARKVLSHAWKHRFAVEKAGMYRIQADWHFDAAVDASLLLMRFGGKPPNTTATVHSSLNSSAAETVISYEDDMLVADADAYQRWKHLCGDETMKWRSGVKHDCSKIMELKREGAKYRNGTGELVELEDTYLYPMLKSSDIAKERTARGHRWMLVAQKTIGENTAKIQVSSPKTWAYLKCPC